LAQSVFSYIQGQAPNWQPQDGNLDVWIIRAVTALAAENRDLASDVQDSIFRYYGATLVGILPLDATAAQGNTTWTAIDTQGYTIPSGTNVGIVDQSGNTQAFVTTTAITIPAGQNITATGAVPILATVPGSAGNNVGTAGGPVQLIDVLDWVQSVSLVSPTVGGADAESDAAYLNRLTTRLSHLSQRPILPADFAYYALDATTAIWRAVAIDGYNPADGTYNNQRMVTVAAIDINGNAASATAKTAISTYLQANREVNFVVNVIDPHYTTINVAVTYHLEITYDQTATDNAVTNAINGYLSPATWGQDPTILENTQSQTWLETPTVYYNELLTAISNVVGVARVTALTVNGGTTDVTLTTPAALTQPGTITITHA
ncbi:MAG TPA: baseplate J/gp47 family protein, partial [Candidatus Saccharimonadales bacterium]